MKRLLQTLFSSLFVLAACVSTEVTTQEASLRDSIKIQISAYERGIDPARLSVLPGDIVPELFSLADDTKEKIFYRRRALAALRFYPEERVYQFLSTKLSEPSVPSLLPEAISSLVSAFGEKRPDEIAPLLSGFLQDASPVLRESAARGLLQLPSSKAKEAVELAAKEDETIRAVLEGRE